MSASEKNARAAARDKLPARSSGRKSVGAAIFPGSAVVEPYPTLDHALDGRERINGATYGAIAEASPAYLVQALRQGVSPKVFRQVAADMAVDQSLLIQSLGLPRSTLLRKLANDQPLTISEGERVLGLAQLVAEAMRMVRDSGDDSNFDAAAWLGRWVQQSVPALGNRRPADFLDTAIGQQSVMQTLRQIESGAYA